MARIFWIVGLSFALLVFGGWTVGILIAGVTHRHLNQKGWIMLVGNAYIVWITFNYLRTKISEERNPQAPMDSN
jgi:threonine/homoserine/homoserine lactone efflux protein